jgi:DNA-binding Xre family transcriptional regulator
MIVFRRLLGDVLRRHRQLQSRTLRDVAAAARISLGYLSEIERGRKEASSELLTSLCAALDISLADVLREVSDDISALEQRSVQPVGFTGMRRPQPVVRPVAGVAPLRPTGSDTPRPAVPAVPVATLSSGFPGFGFPGFGFPGPGFSGPGARIPVVAA